MGLDDIGSIGNLLGGSGGLSSLLGGGGDPIATVIDEVGSALGLPKELTGAAKIGAAIYTGDVMCGVSGGMELMQGVEQDGQKAQAQPATTECPVPSTASGEGYAKDPDDVPTTDDDDDDSVQDADDGDAGDVDDVDDDTDDVDDGDNVTTASPALVPGQQPVQTSLPSDPAQPASQGQGAGGLLGGLFGGGGIGGLFGGSGGGNDLLSSLFKLPSNPIEMLLSPPVATLLGLEPKGAQQPGQAQTHPAGQAERSEHTEQPHRCSREEWEGYCDEVRSCRRDDSGWDSKFRSALDVLHDRYDLLETAAGGERGQGITKDDLRAALGNPDMPDDVKDACRFLLRNPAAWNMVDAASDHGQVDGRITREGIRNAWHEIDHGEGRHVEHHREHHVEHHHEQPNRSDPDDDNGGSGAQGTGSGTPDIGQLLNSGMDVEELVELVLSQCLNKMDDEIKKKTADISKKSAEAQNQNGANGSQGGQGASGGKASSSGDNLQTLQTQLQDLVQKRQQLFSLMTNISSDFNETSKQILQNLGRA